MQASRDNWTGKTIPIQIRNHLKCLKHIRASLPAGWKDKGLDSDIRILTAELQRRQKQPAAKGTKR